MPLRIQCPHLGCGVGLQVKEELTGRQIQCPACGRAMIVPSAAGSVDGEPEPTHKGKPLRHWVRELRSKDGKRRTAAVWAIEEIGPRGAEAVPDLMALLEKDDSLTSELVSALGAVGPAAAAAVPALIDRLENRGDPLGSMVSYCATKALGAIGPAAVAAIPDLVRLLAGPRAETQETAAAALAKIGPASVPMLVKGLAARDSRVRAGSALALGLIGPAAATAVPGLTGLLADQPPLVRLYAAQALWRVGRRAGPAVPVLIDIFQTDGQYEDAVPEEWVYSRFEGLRAQAAETLGEIGAPDAQSAISVLLRGLETGESRVEAGAVRALGKISGGSRAVLTALTRLVAEADDSMEEAIMALGDLGPPAAASLPVLRDALSVRSGSNAPKLHVMAAEAIWKIDRGSKPLLAVYQEGLKPERLMYQRRDTAERAARLGVEARPLIPALQRLLRDEDREVRQAAAQTLRDINAALSGRPTAAAAPLPRPVEPEPVLPSQPQDEAAADAGRKAMKREDYPEAVRQYLRAYLANPAVGKHLVNCGAMLLTGVRGYLFMAARVTIAGCRSGRPQDLFLTWVLNPKVFAGGLLGQQVRAAVGREDRDRLADCLRAAELCFRSAVGLAEGELALVWLLDLTRATGRFADGRNVLTDGERSGRHTAEQLQEARGFADSVPNYEADLAWAAGTTGGWVIPGGDLLARPMLDRLANAAREVTGHLPSTVPAPAEPKDEPTTIRVSCPHCSRSLQAPHRAVGHQARCKQCGQTFVVRLPRPWDEPTGGPRAGETYRLRGE